MTTPRDERIASELRRLRGRRTSADVHAAVGITPSKLSRIESCKVRASAEDVRALAEFYGADPSTVERLTTYADEQRQPVWWREFIGPDWDAALSYHLELETEAERIDSWTIDLVPGLLQVPTYTTALITSRVDVPSEQLERRLELRAKRQERVQCGELELWAVLSEAVLHGQIGGPDVLREQLQHLANAPRNVTVQVLPFTAGAHSGLGSSFHMIHFANWPTMLYQETIKRGLYEDDPDTVKDLSRTMQDVRATALSPRDSRQALRQRADELEE